MTGFVFRLRIFKATDSLKCFHDIRRFLIAFLEESLHFFAVTGHDCLNGFTACRGGKLNFFRICQSRQPANTAKATFINPIFQGISNTQKDFSCQVSGNSAAVIANSNRLFSTVNIDMDCSFISRQNTGRNRLINCICAILYIFTVDMHWIGIHALCQNFQKKLTSYWLTHYLLPP